jgi:hypothetical protein
MKYPQIPQISFFNWVTRKHKERTVECEYGHFGRGDCPNWERNLGNLGISNFGFSLQ